MALAILGAGNLRGLIYDTGHLVEVLRPLRQVSAGSKYTSPFRKPTRMHFLNLSVAQVLIISPVAQFS